MSCLFTMYEVNEFKLLHLGCTVKRVCKEYHKDQLNVVLIHTWSLHAGSITWKLLL